MRIEYLKVESSKEISIKITINTTKPQKNL